MDDSTNPPAPHTLSSWEYAPETIPAILKITNLKRDAWVAEIGAGSGIFTQHLIGRFNHILAFEPDPFLRETAFRRLGHFPSFCVIEGTSESTNWYDHSIDLILSTQIIDQLMVEASQTELRRILRRPSWFVIINHYNTDNVLASCLQQKIPPDLLSVFLPSSHLNETLLHPYFSHHRFVKISFPVCASISWLQFLERLKYASNRINPLTYQEIDLVSTALEIFNEFEICRRVQLHMCTEVYIGRL